MSSYVVCGCCGQHISASTADIGRAVVCPTSRRLILVNEGDLRVDAAPIEHPRTGPGRRTFATIAVLALLLALASYLAWDQFGQPEAGRKDSANGASVEIVERSSSDAGANTTPPAGGAGFTTPAAAATSGNGAATSSNGADSNRPTDSTGGNLATAAPTPAAPMPAPTSAVDVASNTNPMPAPTQPSVANSVNAASTPARGRLEVTGHDQRGMSIYHLAKRIDLRSPEQLQDELLKFREVALDTPTTPQTSAVLLQIGLNNRKLGLPYPGPMTAARKREDLAELPFRFGSGTTLKEDQAKALDARSRELRTKIQQCLGGTDPRPDPDRLYEALLKGEEGQFRDRKWATAESVPCIQQMLQADGEQVRRMSVELLRGIELPNSTEALVRWAVFDVAAANRAAAVDALKDRDRAAVMEQLLTYLRYPWPRAVEHAAEALVALNCVEAVPGLVALLPMPAPDAPQAPSVAGDNRLFRREVVRVNHPRNCLMCHPPSGAAGDLVRAAIPDPSKPLPSPLTPAYYNSGGQFVTAATTYLRQEFSTVLPVPSPGLWPGYQRFDFMVATRPMRKDEVSNTASAGAFSAAILFALRELSGRNLGTAAADWDGLRNGRPSPDDRLLYEAARYLALYTNADPFILLTLGEFGRDLFELSEAEQTVVFARLRRMYGAASTRLGLIAFFSGVLRTGDPTRQERARLLLTRFLGREDLDPIDPSVALKMLNSPRAYVRIAGLSALGSLGKDGLVHYKLLLKALKDEDAEVRLAAAIALGDLTSGPDEVYESLALATQDGADRVRLAAAKSLAQLKLIPRNAARPLAEGLVRKYQWGSAEEREAFEKLVASLLEDMNRNSASGYAAVLKAASGETPTDVPAATLARLLRIMGPPQKDQLPTLATLLGKPEYRTIADDQLFAAGDDAVPALIATLKDDREKVRIVAAELLGRAASVNRRPAASPAMWRAAGDALASLKARDPSGDVQRAADAALKNLTEKKP